MFEAIVIVIALAWLASGPIALCIASGQHKDLKTIKHRLAALEAPVAAAMAPAAAIVDLPAAMAYPDPTPAYAASTAPAPSVPEPPAPPPPPDEIPPTAPPSPPEPPRDYVDLERKITLRWAVWLGGVAMALGGVFLVRYTIEIGLLSPEVRVVLGILLGVALTIGGEKIRRGWLRAGLERTLAASYIPEAISAAGIAITFASIYATFALYAFIGTTTAFVALAGVAFTAVILSIWQGPFIAALGILGAFSVPMLVGGSRPDAFTLFGYLIVVTAAALQVARERGVVWLAALGHAGFGAWLLLWFAAEWRVDQADIMALILLAHGGLILTVARWPGRLQAPMLTLITLGAAGIATVGFVASLRWSQYGPIALASFWLFSAGTLWIARRDDEFVAAPWMALVAICVAIVTWHWPTLNGALRPVAQIVNDVPAFSYLPDPRKFLAACAAFAALFGVGGWWALRGRYALSWAGVSALGALVIAIMAYARIGAAAPDLPWTATFLGLAALASIAAQRLPAESMAGPRAIYALAGLIAVGCAMVAAFTGAMLTLALAMLVPAAAEVERRQAMPVLRIATAIVAVVVLIRLAIDPDLLTTQAGWPIVNPLLLSHGAPALALIAGSLILLRTAEDDGQRLAEITAFIAAVGYATLEANRFAHDGVIFPRMPTFFGHALLATLWFTIATLLVRAGPRRVVPIIGAHVVAAMAGTWLVGILLVTNNPLVIPVRVGAAPIVNSLLLAYAIPAVMMLILARSSPASATAWGPRLRILALALALWWVTVQTRQFFHGTILVGAPADGGEWYAYSAAWLISGVGLLLAGLWTGRPETRWASLAVIGLAVAKVFLSDMGELTGLWRALSFLGLGAVLIGLGWLYQRFVFSPEAPAS